MISLFDIQVNGFAGVDLQQPCLSPEDLRKMVNGLAACQTKRFFATLITDSIPSLVAKFENLERMRASDPVIAAALCGYHLEGPWLSTEAGYRGAHDARLMEAPRLADFEKLQHAAGGNIRLITLAPELPGAAEFIREVVCRGVAVSIGHSNAQETDISEAIAAGARFCTHLGNGVPPLLDRHDNVVQRLLARDELTAFFIPDGIHLPPAVLKNYFRAKPPGCALFTTDCMAAAGSPRDAQRSGSEDLLVDVVPKGHCRKKPQPSFLPALDATSTPRISRCGCSKRAPQPSPAESVPRIPTPWRTRPLFGRFGSTPRANE